MTTILLHGFWGQPADWNPVLARLPLSTSVWIPDLFEEGPMGPEADIDAWVDEFLREVDNLGEDVQAVGYSLGGRLLLKAIVKKPERFRRALLLSARPFIESESETERERWEMDWAYRFLRDSWENLESDWNRQEVFANAPEIPRRKENSLRALLAQSLVNWSPRRHRIGPEDLKSLPEAVDWAFGALDQKYVEVAKGLQKLPVKGQISVIENAGHRLPFEASPWIAQWVERSFL